MNHHLIRNPFLGTWQLDPTRSQYQHGFPPQQGLYRIEPYGEGLKFYMEWVDSEGKSYEMTFTGIPDGREYPFEKPDIAETITLTRVRDNILDSTAKRGGQVVLQARRVLSSDGTQMTITQSGFTDQEQYNNVSMYYRVPLTR